MRLRIGLIGLGAVLALLIALTALNVVPNFVFVGNFRAELIGLLLVLGVGWLILCGLYALARLWIRAETKQITQEQQRVQQAFHQRFLRRLDHEIKNPLAIIRVGMLNLQQTSSQPDSLERLQQQVVKLQKLLEDLRSLTEIENYQLEKVPVNLQTVLEDTLALSQQERVRLHIQQIPWQLSPVLGDQDLLMIAFRNILDNALKFTTPEDRVEIRAIEDGDKAVVEIADTGIGISAADLPNIFDDLYRGQNATSIPGSGLGLTLVQRIIDLHNGSIEIQSRLEQGTVIRLRLPLAK